MEKTQKDKLRLKLAETAGKGVGKLVNVEINRIIKENNMKKKDGR